MDHEKNGNGKSLRDFRNGQQFTLRSHLGVVFETGLITIWNKHNPLKTITIKTDDWNNFTKAVRKGFLDDFLGREKFSIKSFGLLNIWLYRKGVRFIVTAGMQSLISFLEEEFDEILEAIKKKDSY